jgi:hypothetical protein
LSHDEHPAAARTHAVKGGKVKEQGNQPAVQVVVFCSEDNPCATALNLTAKGLVRLLLKGNALASFQPLLVEHFLQQSLGFWVQDDLLVGPDVSGRASWLRELHDTPT